MGRPKSYQRDEVVGQALELFRECGYAGTSVDDLIKATGINRYSFYEAFGDKRGLFMEVLARFNCEKVYEASAILNRPGPKIPLFRLYFQKIQDNARRNGPKNCLVTISAVNLANSDPEVAAQVLGHFGALESVFAKALGEAKNSGEIEPRVEILPLARALMNAGRGLRIISQFEGLDRTVEDIIEATLALLNPTLAFQNAHSE